MSFNILLGRADVPTGDHRVVIGSALDTVYIGALTVSAGGIHINSGRLSAGDAFLGDDLFAPAVSATTVFCRSLETTGLITATTLSGTTLIVPALSCGVATVGNLSARSSTLTLSTLSTNTLAVTSISPDQGTMVANISTVVASTVGSNNTTIAAPAGGGLTVNAPVGNYIEVDLGTRYGQNPYDLTDVYRNWGIYYLFNPSAGAQHTIFIPVPTTNGQHITILIAIDAFKWINAISTTGGGAYFYANPQNSGTSLNQSPVSQLLTVNTIYGVDPPTGAFTATMAAEYNQYSFDLVSANGVWCQY